MKLIETGKSEIYYFSLNCKGLEGKSFFSNTKKTKSGRKVSRLCK
jgi:hypothetical protein